MEESPLKNLVVNSVKFLVKVYRNKGDLSSLKMRENLPTNNPGLIDVGAEERHSVVNMSNYSDAVQSEL